MAKPEPGAGQPAEHERGQRRRRQARPPRRARGSAAPRARGAEAWPCGGRRTLAPDGHLRARRRPAADDRRYELEGLAAGLERVRAPHDDLPPARRRRGGPRRGRRPTTPTTSASSRSAARCSRSPARGRSTRSRGISTTLDLFPAGDAGFDAYRNYRRWAFESAALDLALRQAGTLAGRPRSAASRAGDVRRLAPDRRAADAAPVDAAAGRLPGAALQARRDAGLGRRADRRLRRHRRGRLDRLQGRLQGHRRSTRRPTRSCTGASRRRSRTPGSRIPTSTCRRRARRSRPYRGPDHLGRADPLGAGHPRPPRAPAHGQPQAFALRRVRALFEAYDFCARARHGRLRRRAVRARRRPRADPVPRREELAVRWAASGRASRRRPSGRRRGARRARARPRPSGAAAGAPAGGRRRSRRGSARASAWRPSRSAARAPRIAWAAARKRVSASSSSSERASSRCIAASAHFCSILDLSLLGSHGVLEVYDRRRKPVGSGSGRAGSAGGRARDRDRRSPPGAMSFGASAWNSAARYWIWPRPTPSSNWPPPYAPMPRSLAEVVGLEQRRTAPKRDGLRLTVRGSTGSASGCPATEWIGASQVIRSSYGAQRLARLRDVEVGVLEPGVGERLGDAPVELRVGRRCRPACPCRRP